MKSILFAPALLATLAGCASKASPPDSKPTEKPGVVALPAVAVATEPLQRTSLRGIVSAEGQVIANAGAQATLSFPTDGQITTVNVNVGDQVSKGEVLASLDPRLAQSAIVQAQADVTTAQANLAKAAAGARRPELAANSAIVGGAQARVQVAKSELRRQQALAGVGISSQRNFQQAQSDYQSALADLRSKQQEGVLLQAGPRPQDVQVARAQLQQARVELQTAQTKASLLDIIAPFSGVVTQRMKNPGETVDTTSAVLTLVNPANTLVEVQLSQDKAALVRVGDRATITADVSTRRVPGRVSSVNAAFGQDTRTMAVRIRPDSAALAPGASAKANIVVQNVHNGIVVPDSAVVKDPDTGQPLIYLAKGRGEYERVPVQIVLQSGSRIAISGAGLNPGARVVTQGAYELLPFAGGTSSD